jgi:hypothetical protein
MLLFLQNSRTAKAAILFSVFAGVANAGDGTLPFRWRGHSEIPDHGNIETTLTLDRTHDQSISAAELNCVSNDLLSTGYAASGQLEFWPVKPLEIAGDGLTVTAYCYDDRDQVASEPRAIEIVLKDDGGEIVHLSGTALIDDSAITFTGELFGNKLVLAAKSSRSQIQPLRRETSVN